METVFLVLALGLFLGLFLIVGAGIAVWLAMRLSRSNVFTVKDGQGKSKDGLPFYIKRGRLIHETAYLESLADVTLTLMETIIDAEGKPGAATPVSVATRTVSLSADGINKLAALQAAAEAQPGADRAALWGKVEQAFNALPAYTGEIPDNPPMVLNAIRVEAYVDYDNQHTINAVMPLVGSSELAAELAADGTLSKATAKAEDSTLTTLLGALPSPELVGLLKPEASAGDADELARKAVPGDRLYEIRLMIERRAVRHWLSKVVDRQEFDAPIPLNQNPHAWYRRETDNEPPKPKEEKKEEKEEEK